MNNPITSSQFEPILSSISIQLTDNSYELWHRFRILTYANLLNGYYHGDIDIICALVFLQGVGVSFFDYIKGNENVNSIVEVGNHLNNINFPPHKVSSVMKFFEPVDKGISKLSLIEHQIVNDAVLLAGLGAGGLARYLMRIEFNKSGVSDIRQIDRFFKERFAKLILPESISVAEKENKFIYLFSALLNQEPSVEARYPGKYIILEGNSGTGKDKQAELLKNMFESKREKVTVVKEPSQIYRDFETYFETTAKVDLTDSAPIFRLYSIIGDRYNQIHERVTQELQQGRIVISVRSYISMLVYQCENEIEKLFVNFIHRFVPRPDVAIIYDATEEICLQRAILRGTKMTRFDKLENLKRFRPAYLDIAKSYLFDFPVEIVDASGTIEQVAEKTKKIIDAHL